MAGEQPNYQAYAPDPTLKMQDLEEKQRMMKNQMLLIGQNLVDFREKIGSDIIEIKKEIGTLKDSVGRLLSFFDTASDELSKFARKEDLDIIAKQMRMFQPLADRRN